MMEQILALPVANVRSIGLLTAFTGVVLVWLVRS
jgi:uncharacterized protein YjeT (DUF2065 family)